MGHASGAAVDLSVPAVIPRAVPDEVPLPGFQRRSRHHRLEHRADRIGREGAVQERAVRGRQALAHMGRVEAGPADAGPHLAAAGLQDQDAPGGHALCRHPLCGPLDAAGEGQPHPLRGGGCLFQHRLTAPPQTPLRRDCAPEDVLPAGGKDVVQRRFEARRAAALAVQIADEMFRQRGGGVPPGHSIAPHAQPPHILRHLQQEGPGGVPLPVEHRLPVSVRVGVEPRITALPREAEGQPLLRKPRQRQAVAVVEVPPRRRQAQDGLALRRCPRCVSGVRAEPVQPADHRRKPQQKRPIQRKHPPARHKTAPFPAP